MKKVIFAIALLLLPIVGAEDFPTQNINSGFVGWQSDFTEEIGEYRISYPSVANGEGINMAQNGPFAIVIFMGDDGEDTDQYEWLQDGLSKWGYIVLVVQDGVKLESILNQLSVWNSGEESLVPDSQSMFALDHISLGGHGTGAHTAAELLKTGLYEIDGLFGLGLDGSETDYTGSVILPRPSSALFLTGTTDDIAPASENVYSYLQNWPGAWQIMYPLGANHVGYQESDTFFERLVDGDSTMGREGQQDHALAHIIPYLNLTLRGDDSAYQFAFNREDKSVSADDESYIDEDLDRSRLYLMQDTRSSLENVTLNQTFTVSSNVTLRNGDIAFGNVSCLLPDGDIILGGLQNGVASCDINGTLLSPGMAKIELRISDYSFSDWTEITIQRVGLPLEISQPLNEVYIDQHSSVVIYPGDFATDPDGEEVLFTDAQIFGDEQRLGLSNSLSELEISHVADQEWDGTVQMNITLAAGDDSANITVNVTVLPIDDPVYQFETIPQFQSVEDGDNIIFDLNDYVTDPEGESLVSVVARDYVGLRINTSIPSSILIDPQSHWNGGELVEILVSDGNTTPITVTVPINIEPVDDSVEFSKSQTDVNMLEDSNLVLELSNFTIDVDGDDLVYSLTGESEIVDTSLDDSKLIITGLPNMNGVSEFIVNVTDGGSYSEMKIIITTESVPDLPTVSLSMVQVDSNRVSLIWTISDSDGDVGLLKSVTLDSANEEPQVAPVNQISTDCSGQTLLTCATYIEDVDKGVYTLEVKVWDSNAQVWSNVVSQQLEITEAKSTLDDSESDTEVSDWILPIGLALVAILLIVYLLQSRRE